MVISTRSLLLAGCLALLVQPARLTPAQDAPPVKNVIVLIADGCSSEQYTLARWFKGAPLALDEMLVGGVKTYISDSVVADSAPAGSAYATGIRTADNFVSVGPKPGTLRPDMEPPADLPYRPLATVLEGARLLGKATGIVATSRLSHATPAAFTAHVPDRGLEQDIMKQAVHQQLDVALGGGEDYLLPKATQADGSSSRPGRRTDGDDLVAVLESRHYTVVRDRQQLEAVKSGKVFGVFALAYLAAEIDRPETRPQEPTLAEMTRKAIELLSSDPEGFFLMVEGSQVDWACHANDPAHMLGDLVMFDKAVGVALDFAKRDGNTLVLALSDHNTGGLSIGNWATNGSYSHMRIEDLIGPLKKMKNSAPEMWRRLCAPHDPGKVKAAEIDPQKVQAIVAECWGVTLPLDQAQRLLQIVSDNPDNPQNAFGAVVCAQYTGVGFTTNGHTGGDVPLFAFGPSRPVGLHDAPEIGQVTARALGLDLDRLNARLFVDIQQAVPEAQVSVETRDTGGLVARVSLGAKSAELPVNTNLLLLGQESIELEGVVVYAPDTKKLYVPRQAVQLIAGQDLSLPSIAR